MRVLKGIVAFIMILLFSCGFSIFAYPYIHNYVVEKDMQEQVQDFWDQLGTDPTEQDTLPTEAPTAPTEPTLPPREHEALWEDMLEYNRRIWEDKQAGLWIMRWAVWHSTWKTAKDSLKIRSSS